MIGDIYIMNKIEINIAKDYTKTPGGRYIIEGEFSGEHFRTTILKPTFERAIAEGNTIVVILDGGYGYPPSFLEEAFGGLVRETKDSRVAQIEIVSDEEPGQIDKIKGYINSELRKIK